eukprot:m.36347 g.36347  ORF g.36347 m.36347 type:complete len:1116 (+) comp32242_c0_seq1:411-3758(+)
MNQNCDFVLQNLGTVSANNGGGDDQNNAVSCRTGANYLGTDEPDNGFIFRLRRKGATPNQSPNQTPFPSSQSSTAAEHDVGRISSPKAKDPLMRIVSQFSVIGVARLTSALESEEKAARCPYRRRPQLLQHLCYRFRIYCRKQTSDSKSKAVDPGAMKACEDMVCLLLNNGANVDDGVKDESMRTALHESAANVHFPVTALKEIFRRTKSVDKQDKDGQTPLHLAFRNKPQFLVFGHVQVLLKAGCNLLAKNSEEKTPLDLLIDQTKRLIKPKSEYSRDLQNILWLVSKEATLLDNFSLSRYVNSLLCLTLLICPATSAKIIIGCGISTKSDQGEDLSHRYPFVVAAGMSMTEPLEKIDLIHDRLSDLVKAHDVDGWNLAHHAAHQGDLDVLKKAWAVGIDLAKADKENFLPLHRAASTASKEAAECLKYLIQEASGSHLAAESNEGTVLQIVLKNKNKEGCAALFRAMSRLSDFDHSELHFEHLQILADEDIILGSADPLWVSLELSHKFGKAAGDSPTRRQNFEEMAQKTEKLAVNLLSGCRSEYVQSVINDDLIDYAIAKEQKQFIASPAVQEYIWRVWLGYGGELNTGKRYNRCDIILNALVGMVLLIVFPCGATEIIGAFPLLSFVSSALSDVLFLGLLIASIVYNHDYCNRSTLTGLDWAIFIFFIGYLTRKLTKATRSCRNERFWESLARKQTKIDLFLLTLFTIYFLLLFIGFYSSIEDETRKTLVRVSYHVYGIGVLGFCIDMLKLLQFHSRLGPIQVSFLSIMKVTLMFLVILSAFWLGFSLSITSVYTASEYMAENTTTTFIHNDVDGLWRSLRSLFWALFGLVEKESFEQALLPEAIVGTLLLAVWLVVSVIVLLNMLIALISNSFQRVEDNADLEWKFSRAKIVRDMACNPTVPVPLNLLSLPCQIIFHGACSKRNKEKKEKQAEERKKKFKSESDEAVKRYKERRDRQRDADAASRVELSLTESRLHEQLESEATWLKNHVRRMESQIEMLVREMTRFRGKRKPGSFRNMSRRHRQAGKKRISEDGTEGVDEVDFPIHFRPEDGAEWYPQPPDIVVQAPSMANGKKPNIDEDFDVTKLSHGSLDSQSEEEDDVEFTNTVLV